MAARKLIDRWHVGSDPEQFAINKDGKVFDVYPPNATGAKAAEKVCKSLKDSKP